MLPILYLECFLFCLSYPGFDFNALRIPILKSYYF
jgi:hypothetical protein